MSLVLEPVADEMKGKIEINSTGGLLNDIETLNDEIAEEMRNKFSSRQEGLDPDDGITEEQSNSKEPSKEQSNQETENEEVKECETNHHQGDIRFYLQKGKRGFPKDTLRTSTKPSIHEEDAVQV